jgi:hypothetical protein
MQHRSWSMPMLRVFGDVAELMSLAALLALIAAVA